MSEEQLSSFNPFLWAIQNANYQAIFNIAKVKALRKIRNNCIRNRIFIYNHLIAMHPGLRKSGVESKFILSKMQRISLNI